MKLEPIYISPEGNVGAGVANDHDTVVTVQYDDGEEQQVWISPTLPAVIFAQALGRLHGDDRRMTKIIF